MLHQILPPKSSKIVYRFCLITCALSIALLVSCGGGSGGGSGNDNPVSPGPADPAPLASEQIRASEGGRVTVVSPDALAGTEIVIPANALSSDATITLDRSDATPGNGFVSAVIDISPDGIQFDPMARVTVRYDEADLPVNTDESTILIAKALPTDRLAALLNITVDTSANTVSGDTTSLSDFVVVLPTASGLPQPPVANAGADQTATLLAEVMLDGSGSNDVNGDALDYAWSFEQRPDGSAAQLSDTSAIQPRFTVDQAGDYTIQLRVNDDQFLSEPDTVTVSTINSAPVANAGVNQSARVGDRVTFDGSASSDIDGDPFTFQWILAAQPAGSSATLSEATTVTPFFDVDQAGLYVGQLIVSDGSASSAPDTVEVTTDNSAPVASAGADQTVLEGDTVLLDGSPSTDVDGDVLSYRWSLLSVPVGSSAALSQTGSLRPSFVADLAGLYVVQLIVDDGALTSAPDTSNVTAGAVNHAPVSDAGPDQSVGLGANFVLDGSASSDADSDPITYRWSLTSKPDGSGATLSDRSVINPTATADLPGSYVAQLTVSDGQQDSVPDTVVISTENSRPVADAGADIQLFVGETVQLDGIDSSDADGDPLSFQWSLTALPENSNATLSDVSAVDPTFVMDRPGTAVAQLIVDDGTLASVPDTVAITTKNSAPTANAGIDQLVLLGDTVILDGSASSDVDDDTLTYQWELLQRPDGSSAALLDATLIQPQFGGDVAGDYVAALIVDDGEFVSLADQVVVTVSDQAQPLISSLSPLRVAVGDLVTVDGENLAALSGALPTVTLARKGGGSIAAPVANSGDNAISFTVPADATSGIVSVAIGAAKVTSDDALEIVTSNDFSLTVSPGSIALMRGESSAYAVTLESANGFSQLASLSLSGLPQGASAIFKPQRITAGQSALLTLSAPNDQSLGLSTLTVSAVATVEGVNLRQSTEVTLDVQAVSTSLTGRVVQDDTGQTPLEGVVVSFVGINEKGESTGCNGSTIADAAGSFVFSNLPDECLGFQVLHFAGGSNVNANQLYAEVDQRYFITKDGVVNPPGPVHLPRLDTAETISIIQNHGEDQYFTFESIPNLEITVYAGTTFTLPDGSTPNPFIMYAVDIESDRAPGQTPQTGTEIVPRLLAFQPDGTSMSQQMAVTYPNVMNIAPGTQVPLLALDRLQGMLVPYGTGTVSANGLQIIPDLDPDNSGQRYGLRYLDWFATLLNVIGESWGNLLAWASGLICPSSNDPVGYATGIEVINEVDLAIDCSRGGIVLRRTYRSSSDRDGPFGVGSSHNYGYVLDTASPQSADIVNLVLPNGARVPMSKPTVSSATGGSARSLFINTNNPDFIGNELTARSTGESSYRWKDGRIFNFIPDSGLGVSHLVSITDPRGGKVTLHRNPSQLFEILQIEDGVGRLVNLEYDNRSRITTITDPAGRVLSYTYNSDGTLETVTDPEGSSVRFEYDSEDRLLRKFDELGVKRMENVYDVNGRVTKQTLADGGIITFDYTLLNPGVGTSPVRSTAVTDPLGNATLYRFNPQGHLISATDALGQTTVFEREPGSNLLKSIKGSALCQACGNPGSGDVSFEYDATGNMTAMIDAAGNRFSFTYEPVFNKVDSVTDPLGNQTFVQYDAAGNVTKVTDANGNETTLEYDIYGLLTTVTDPLGAKSTISYDGFANPIAYTDPLGNEFKTRYDATSRPTAAIDALGHRAQTVRDDLGRVTESLGADGQSTKFTYDAMGRMIALTDARGQTTSYTFDAMNRVVTRTDGLNKPDGREYDLGGRLTKFTDRKGQQSTFEYDELNRPVRITFDDGTTVERRYDARSRVIEVIDSASGTYNYRYDELGRLTESLSSQGTIQYQYDALGRITQQQVLGQEAVQYQYDAVGNLIQVKASSAEENYRYDARNQLTQVTRANSVNSDYLYDAAGRLLNIEHIKGSEIIAAQRYSHDANGQRITTRLSEAQAQITEASINEIDALSNQLNKHADITYTYDDNGNRLTSTNAQGTSQYSWDVRNRLTQITKPSGDRQQFFYDYAGNLVSQRLTVNGVVTTENYLTDIFTNVVFQSRSDGQQFSVLTAPGIDQHLALIYGDGSVQYLLRDGLNSTMATVDDGGVVSGRYFYEAFGRTTVSGVEVPFQYTGRVPVGDGLYYYRARFYDTEAGRFVSQDPIGFGGGDVNLYGYVGNNSVLYIDPRGLLRLGLFKIDIGQYINDGMNWGLDKLRGKIRENLKDKVKGEAKDFIERMIRK